MTHVPGHSGLALFVVLSAAIALGDEATHRPDVAPAASNRKDSGPPREVRIPEWVRGTVGCGYTLSVMTAEQRERAVRAGVAISELGFVDPLYVYYDSVFLERRSPHVPRDRIEKEVAEYERLGVRILAVYPPSLQGEVWEKHPDWRRVPTDTVKIPEVDLERAPHGGMLCLLGPYREFFVEVLAEIATRFPGVDAFSFDGLHYGGVCYCGHCRENYRKDSGREIPAVDMDDPAFRRYQVWADRRMEECLELVQSRLEAIDPEIALVTWTTNAGRFGHFLDIPRNMPARMNRLFDAPDQELWLDESHRGSTIVPAFGCAYVWATTDHRVAFSEPYLMTHGNPYGKDSFPPHEVLRRAMLTLTHGACPSLAILQPERLQGAIYEVLGEVRRRQPWLTHKRPEPWAALVMSDDTRVFYGRRSSEVEERYLANVFGVFRAALESHLPLAVINDWNLNDEDLAPYGVLILANTACLSDRQVAAVESFVSHGGGLVATVDVSLFDDVGDPRSGFALAEVLGVDHRGPPSEADEAGVTGGVDAATASAVGADYWARRRGVFDFWYDAESFLDGGRMSGYVGAMSHVTFKGQAVHVRPRSGARVAAWMRSRADAGSADLPAVVQNRHGEGEVVYLAAGCDAAYYLYSYPYQRLVLERAIRTVAARRAPVQVDAPMCVHSTVMRQESDGAERLVVHLFSDLDTTASHGLPNDDVPLREEVVPLLDIRMTFDGRYRLGRIHFEPEGWDLEREETPDGTRVVVPRLEVHGMVVAELEGG